MLLFSVRNVTLVAVEMGKFILEAIINGKNPLPARLWFRFRMELRDASSVAVLGSTRDNPIK